MSYQTIARKYRPRTFKDLIGQKSVSLALMGSIVQKRLPSGVIFSGTRGVGKTSLARIYAKALNCESHSTVDPCGTCLSCKAISAGNHEDVIEIDGASNNGVDEVRSLKETTIYIPQRSQYRIYIIDEVHMLSMSAFNALLKTLEEPPSHVIFIFATTELSKLPQTVVSRCQTFNLQKISSKDISARIEFILEQENIAWEPGVIPLIAKEGQGSLRDALTFLDQVIAIDGSNLKRSSLENILGDLSQSSYIDCLESLLQKDASSCLKQIERLDSKGESFVTVVSKIAVLTRHGFVLQTVDSSHFKKDLWELEEEDLGRLEKIVKASKLPDLNRLFRLLSACLDDLRDSFLDRYIFENACLEWCLEDAVVLERPSNLPSEEIQQVVASEKKQQVVASEEIQQVVASEKKQQMVAAESQVQDRSFPSNWKELVARWKLRRPLQARKLEEVIPYEYSEDKIVLLVDKESLVGPALLRDETQKRVAVVLANLFNFRGDLVVRPKDQHEEHKGEDSLRSEASLSQPGFNRGSRVESLLEEKNRLNDQEKKDKGLYLKTHKVTKGLCDTFRGEVVETFVE